MARMIGLEWVMWGVGRLPLLVLVGMAVWAVLHHGRDARRAAAGGRRLG